MVREPQRNHLRAWREHRGLTQARLAEAVGTTGAVISLLESGDRGLSDKWLRKLAPVLGTRPGHLLELDPAEASSDIMDIWADIPEERRDQAREVLATFRAPAAAPAEPAAPRSPASASVAPSREGRPAPGRRRPPAARAD